MPHRANFQFSEQQFNRLFPFYILIDRELQVISIGESLRKVCALPPQAPFNSFFRINDPRSPVESFQTLFLFKDQLLLLEVLDADLTLRGQIEIYKADANSALFVGSPWFDTMEQVMSKNFSMGDFALHDPLIGLLNILKTQELVNQNVKELLITANNQRNDLQKLSVIAEQSINGFITTNAQGQIEWVNNAFEQITGYTLTEVKGKKPGHFLQGKESSTDTAAYMRRQIQNGEGFYVEVVNYKKNGDPFWSKMVCQPVKDKNGQLTQFFAVQEDITRQKLLEIELERQRNFYEKVLSNIPADIAVFSTDHRYLYINPRGIRDPELRQWMIGKKDEDYAIYRNKPIKSVQDRKKRFQSAVESKKINTWEEKSESPKNEISYMLRNYHPVEDPDGNVNLVIGYGIDITELKKIQTALEISQAQTEELAMAKQQFLAKMSHEIRTPMNGILGVANILEKTGLSSYQKELISIIHESAQNLLVIVNDILDMEKIIAGKLELEEVPFDIYEKVNIITSSFRYKAKEKTIKINYQNFLPDGLVVLGDPYRLSQVLNNIIGNAVKFTEKGAVTISTSPQAETDDSINICFQVEDTGIGIADNQLQNIFEPFKQAKLDISRKFGGTGLGLSISKELVSMLGGEITVESKEGVGSNFKVFISFKKGIETLPAKPQNLIDLNFTQHLNILVAEDTDINQFLLNHILSSWKCRFEIVENGRLAVEAVTINDFDLILMDIQMQEMDGLEATKIIRNLPQTNKAEIPIVAITANALRGDEAFFLAEGMNACLTKPFNETDLFNTILKVLNKSFLVAPATKPTPDQPVLFSLQNLESMAKGSTTFVQQMVDLFLDIMPALQDQLQSAAHTADWDKVAQTAHKMKPLIDTLQINQIKETIQQVEQIAKSRAGIAVLQTHCKKIHDVIDLCLLQLRREFQSAASGK